MKVSQLFKQFAQSERSGGFVLIACTLVSILIANSSVGAFYLHFLHQPINLSVAGIHLDLTVTHWINDGLMTVFFLLVGLEIERELYIGELSSIKNALLPVLAAAGGMIVPALIHYLFNRGTVTASGFGIPMATDIAFALGILSLAGKRVPLSLKIFLTAFAIIDDLGAITVIAVFYSTGFSILYFAGAIIIFLMLFIAGRYKVYYAWLYIIGGIIMWYCMLHSGIHASVAGVLLAFAIPFQRGKDGGLSYRIQHALHYPVAFGILPLFALANTAIVFPPHALQSFATNNSVGILAGLVIGKLAGIYLTTTLAVKTGMVALAGDISRRQLLAVSLLGGIGFTMSIFITNLAFTDSLVITASKMSILLASFVAACSGLLVLKSGSRRR